MVETDTIWIATDTLIKVSETFWKESEDEYGRYVYYSGGDIAVRNENNYARSRICSNSDNSEYCSVFSGHRSRGTFADPLDVQSNDLIANFSGIQYVDGKYRPSAAMEVRAGDNLGYNSYPAHIIFNTVPENHTMRVERMRITSEGNVGINTKDPEAPLHVMDFMKLEPRYSAPPMPAKGMIYYDAVDDKLKVYTGSDWENLN